MELASLVASPEADHQDADAATVAAGPVAETALINEAELLSTLRPWSVDARRRLASSGGVFVTAFGWGKAMDVACR